MKLLLINPNTTEAITSLVVAEALKLVPSGVDVKGVTGRFGGRYVACRATYAIAGHAALEAYAEHGRGADAVVLACFGDPALAALKEIATVPVTGMAEAACLTAARQYGRFAIVTGGERWGPMLREFVALLGLTDRLATVMTVAPTGADIARDPERALDLLVGACQACVARHGAQCVVLGGAGLAGLAPRIQHRVPVPVVDGLAAAIAMALDARQRSAAGTASSSAGREGTNTVGLSDALSGLLSAHS